MKPKLTWLLGFLAIPCLIASAILIFQKGDLFSLFSHPVTLSGSVPEIVHHSRQIQHAEASARLEIVIGLKTHNDTELDALIARQQDPSSQDYQRFLSVDQFTQHFSPTQSQVDDVVKFLTTSGITVEQVYANRLLIQASGTVGQLEQAFHVTINRYQSPSTTPGSTMPAATYFSNDRDPSIPAALSPVVETVIGLNTLTAYRSHLLRDAPVVPPPGQPPVQPPGPTPVPTQPAQLPLTPRDIATVYNFPNANNKRPAAIGTRQYSGKGVNLAIVTALVYDPAEVEAYWKQSGVVRHGTVTDINVGTPGKDLGDETTLDLELAGAQAPGANIKMYIAAAPAMLFFTITYARVVNDNNADVMSVSWGLCEDHVGARLIQTDTRIFREAAVQGIALFSSAGDDGAYDCGAKPASPGTPAPPGTPATPTTPALAVDYPSSSPYVTAVGGTSLLEKDGVRVSEVVWKKGGGGISTSQDLPLWQVAPTLPPGNLRATTDISLDADPHTGYTYYFQGKWERIGGTSASTPTWAALWTLVLQATGQRVGSANYYVYRMGSLKEYHQLFYDVTQGNNGADVGPGYSAGPGWDIPSGWGTPNGAAIVNWMIQVSPSRPPEDKSLGQKHPVKTSH
jgi:kumamolisin